MLHRLTPLTLALILATTLLSGCAKQIATATAKGPEAASEAKATVAATGTRFDPPIQVAKVPASAWYCDMGTVHYARMDKGDGICELCKMNLKQAAGAATP